jgi:hypothetical protein
MGSDPAEERPGPDPGRTEGADSGERACTLRNPPGEIVAWRAWRVRDGHRLFSVFFDSYEWFPGVAAQSTVNEPGMAWSLSSQRGLHAFKHPPQVYDYINETKCYGTIDKAGWLVEADYVWGEVELWGTVWEHEDGYRAQYARPRSFKGWEGQVDLERLIAKFIC